MAFAVLLLVQHIIKGVLVEMSSLGWPKTVPDFESAGACYVDAAQLENSFSMHCIEKDLNHKWAGIQHLLPSRSASELRYVKHVAKRVKCRVLLCTPRDTEFISSREKNALEGRGMFAQSRYYLRSQPK
eukprot:scaffold45272_cov16-Tisochrysis_lutea.AAC.1